MAGIRPAKTIRTLKAQPWTRTSRRKPRKSYVKGVPHTKIRQFNMGADKRYDLEIELVAKVPIQLRDNALEAARMAANKLLEKELPGNYFVQVVCYPHLVLREHSALGVAGADRISKGMKRAFGKPKGRVARIHVGDAIYRARVYSSAVNTVKRAFKRASIKLSGHYEIRIRDITNDPANLARKLTAEVIKEKVVEVPKEEAKAEEVVPAAEAAAAPAGKGGEKKEEAKAEAKPEAKGKAAPEKKK